MSNGELSDVEKSAPVLAACGFRVVPLREPIGVWHILAVSNRTLLLVSVQREFPKDVGRFGHPYQFPAALTTRLIHRWTDGQPLPQTQFVS